MSPTWQNFDFFCLCRLPQMCPAGGCPTPLGCIFLVSPPSAVADRELHCVLYVRVWLAGFLKVSTLKQIKQGQCRRTCIVFNGKAMRLHLRRISGNSVFK